MKLFNSETREIEVFVPRNKNEVTIYTCGPTVYHFAHIGNLRTYIMEDVLVKALEFIGYNVKRVMNITDVGHLTGDVDSGEDKMLKGAEREHKSVMEIAKFYTEAFKKDCLDLNLAWPKIIEPATNCIDNYIEIIKGLIDKGFAYKSEGNIYFDTSKLENYYRLTSQGSNDLLIGARDSVDEDTNKKNKNDFVLWFTKSKFENQALKWNSPWGEGYPGWHIECSGICFKHCGEYLDIHCGGVDNKFPHHTNEIAQTESFVGHKWCGLWFHVEHLNTLAGKMSKSSGEFSTLSSLKEKGFAPEVYKFFCLQSHYRRQLVFSLEGLQTAKSAYEKLIQRIGGLEKESGNLDLAAFEKFTNQFKACLENDLNTSSALTTVFDVLKEDISDKTKFELLRSFDRFLGLSFEKAFIKEDEVVLDKELTDYISEMIARRLIAKNVRDFALADSIRAELLSKNIELIDTKDGTTFKLK